MRKRLLYVLLVIYVGYRLFDFAIIPQIPRIQDQVYPGDYCKEASLWFQYQYQAAPNVLPPCH